jgi:hypothetical protein
MHEDTFLATVHIAAAVIGWLKAFRKRKDRANSD